MNIDLDYKTFCDTYYDAAVQVADITIAEHIKSHGQLNPYIDVTLVKDLGISYGLEKVYNTFDVDHESRAKIKTYLSKVVHNCVLTELGKESTAVGAKKRSGKPMDSMVLAATIGGGNASLESFSGTFKTSGRFQKNMCPACRKHLINPLSLYGPSMITTSSGGGSGLQERVSPPV